jgi:ABC transport system ATP-binding/permease protein
VLLEMRLLDYAGTVLVVSHDRSFLDNLCTSTLVLEGVGKVGEYAGGYSDWKRVVERRRGEGAKSGTTRANQGAKAAGSDGGKRSVTAGSRDQGPVGTESASGRARPGSAVENQPTPKPRKLTFSERRELEALPARIEALEQQLEDLHQVMARAAPTREGAETIRRAGETSKALEAEIRAAYGRWEELSSKE